MEVRGEVWGTWSRGCHRDSPVTAIMVFSQGDRGEKGDRGEQVSWDRGTVPSIHSYVVPLLRRCRALCGASRCPVEARSGHTRKALLSHAL